MATPRRGVHHVQSRPVLNVQDAVHLRHVRTPAGARAWAQQIVPTKPWSLIPW